MKLPFDQMKFLYESSYHAMIKTLFEENLEKHGWTYQDYQEAAIEHSIAIEEGELQEWVH